MSRFIFPHDGLYPHCRRGLDDGLRNLQRAVSDCLFDIPSDFPYRDYLNELERKIGNYRREIKRIQSTLQFIDQRFGDLSDSLYISASRIDIPKFTKRERMIE